MDVLSDVLRAFRLRGTLYFRGEFRAPFGVEVPQTSGSARFHVALHGQGWVQVLDEEPQLLQRGDLVVVPHGRPHVLSDDPNRETVSLEAAIKEAGYTGEGPFRHGGVGSPAVLVCGEFAFDTVPGHPFLSELPSMLHFPSTESRNFMWLDDVMNFLGHEAKEEQPGSEAVLTRLAEILFVQVLRAYMESSNAPSRGLAGLADSNIKRSLRVIHEAPGEPWTVATLATKAGLSRTTFAEKFHDLVGITPMQYLMAWRVERAKAALSDPTVAIGVIAEQVGYKSEAAFSRAFKKLVGVGPGNYRMHHRVGG
jgi:AraC-like DNA-binding protein